jgi:hypothetical protein
MFKRPSASFVKCEMLTVKRSNPETNYASRVLNTKLADFFSILLERLLHAVQGAGVAFVYEEVDGHRRHVRCVDKRRVCVERGVHLRYCVHASFGQDARVIAGPHPTTAPRQVAILFILITVKLDVLSFVDRKVHRPHKRGGLFVHLLAWPHRQGVRSALLPHQH